jgi:hypothetical protein
MRPAGRVRHVSMWLCFGLIAGLSYWPVGPSHSGALEYESAVILLSVIGLFLARVNVWIILAIVAVCYRCKPLDYILYSDVPIFAIPSLILAVSDVVLIKARMSHAFVCVCGSVLIAGFWITHAIGIEMFQRHLILSPFDLPVDLPAGSVEACVSIIMLASLGARALLFQYVIEDEACTNCGYSLRGLPVRRCPECGTTSEVGAGHAHLVWRGFRKKGRPRRPSE